MFSDPQNLEETSTHWAITKGVLTLRGAGKMGLG